MDRAGSSPCLDCPSQRLPPILPAIPLAPLHRSTAASASECFGNFTLTSPPHGALVQSGLLWEFEGMPSGVNIPPANLDFAWDRPETADSLRERLLKCSRSEWLRLAAWILREARVEQVWQFLSLREVADAFPHLCGRLGRRRSVWEYLLRAAHELGRL
jgi:hypothetical protein